MWLRRFVVIGGAVALTIAGAHEMYLVFAVNGVTPLAIFILALFLALFAWIALSFTSGLAGFCSMLAGGGCRLGTGPDTPLPRLTSKTALLMPTYNEQPVRVMAGLQAIWESLRETGAAEAFDLFILSDTTDRRHLDRGGGWLPGSARANGWTGADILPSPSAECRAQVGQHRRLGDALRRRLCAVPDPRRRQSDDRRDAGAAGWRDGSGIPTSG